MKIFEYISPRDSRRRKIDAGYFTGFPRGFATSDTHVLFLDISPPLHFSVVVYGTEQIDRMILVMMAKSPAFIPFGPDVAMQMAIISCRAAQNVHET